MRASATCLSSSGKPLSLLAGEWPTPGAMPGASWTHSGESLSLQLHSVSAAAFGVKPKLDSVSKLTYRPQHHT